jgi:hypothetical protein
VYGGCFWKRRLTRWLTNSRRSENQHMPRGLLNDLTSAAHLNLDVETEHVVENDMD